MDVKRELKSAMQSIGNGISDLEGIIESQEDELIEKDIQISELNLKIKELEDRLETLAQEAGQ
jgi:chromosome segregation ATPase